MTDGDDAEIEPGTTLPVPPSLDGISPTSGGDDVEGDGYPFGDREDLFAGDLSPCQPGCDDDDLEGNKSDSGPWNSQDQDTLAQDAAPARKDQVLRGRFLSDAESKVLDSMVNQAMLSASLDDGLQLPWETGVMASIFGDAPLASMPSIPSLAHSMDDRKVLPSKDQPSSVEPQPKRQRVLNSTLRMFERAIQFKNVLTDHDADEVKWNRALEKLYTVMISSPGTVPEGVRFKEGHMDLNLKQIRILCGSRSPNTVAKRATSLMKYCIWHRGFFYRRNPLPLDSEEVAEYIWEKHQDGMAYSAMVSFVEAANFAVHVLGIPLKRPNAPLVTAFTKGILDKTSTNRPGRKQARPLKVVEVVHLEDTLNNESLDLFDRYAAGAFLFAVYARCRWSDLRSVNGCELDVDVSNDRLVGFISFNTFSHKTASQVAKHGLPMPLIAPIWGLGNPPWAMTWKKEAVSLDFANFAKGAILPAPDVSGKWTHRSVTSVEATRWLLELLKPFTSDLEDVSSHSLKATTLSWLAKAGCDPHRRTVLAHHSSGKGSLEVYSRDMLSAPLRTLEEALRQIRIGALCPDLTRSGHIKEPSKPDCKDAPVKETEGRKQKGQSSSSSSTSSSTSSSSGGESADEQQLIAVGGADPGVHLSAWGNFNMFQHELSKIVHAEADSDSCTFKCGMKATAEHKLIVSTAFLESRKCKRCLRAIENS